MIKSRLLLVGLILATFASTLLPFFTDTAYANGEKYVWKSATIIAASGGAYTGTTLYNLTRTPPTTVSGAKSYFYATNPGMNTPFPRCGKDEGALLVLNTDPDVTKDTSAVLLMGKYAQSNGIGTDCVPSEQGVDRDVSIKKGATTPTTGSTTDCSKLSGDAKTKCEVVNACTKSVQKPDRPTCENAWDNCIKDASDAVVAACKKEISNGNIQYDSIRNQASEQEKSTNTCAIEGIGWIVCPVMSFLAKINDGMFKFIGDNFLKLNIGLFDTKSGTYEAWKVFRTYANIAFVGVFLIIIYSQVTSAGISNYGIKRMLPRLIIAAILVNVSYYLCQAAIDLSNILGFGLNTLFNSIPVGKTQPAPPQWVDVTTKIIGGAALGVAALGAILAFGSSVLIASLLALALIVLILIARQAAIVLLLAVSPIAFVAYLLPNTESWFKKWWTMFRTLLMVFPVIGALFGATALASKIILLSASDPDIGTEQQMTLQFTALAILAIPLFAVPSILKGAMAAAGSIGARLQGAGDRATGRLSKSAKDTAKTRYERSSFAQGRALRKAGEEKYRRTRFADRVTNGGVRAALAKGVAVTPTQRAGQEHLAAAATQASFKAFDESVAAEKSLLSNNGVVAQDLHSVPLGSSPTFSPDSLDGMVRDTKLSAEQRSAAASRLIQTGSDRNIHEMLDYLGTTSDEGAGTIQKQVAGDLGQRKPKSLGQADVSNLATGTYGAAGGNPPANFDSKVIGRIHGGKQSGESLASASADELARIEKVLASTPKPAAGTDEAVNRAALSASIDQFYTSAATSGRQVPNDIKVKMDSIKGSL